MLERFDRRSEPMVVNHALLGLHEGLCYTGFALWVGWAATEAGDDDCREARAS